MSLLLRFKSFIDYTAAVCFPPRCVLCDTPSASEGGTLCPICWGELEHILSPYCNRCGIPLEGELIYAAMQTCAGCTASPPAYTRAKAAFVYNDVSRQLISRLKFYDGLHLLPFLAMQAGQAGKDIIALCDLALAVPMHPKRLRERMYNQAALLAKHIGKQHGIPVGYNILKRIRPTEQQTGKSRKARLRNLAGAFTVPSHRLAAVNGKRILLIDDVLTTGATVSRCARALKQAGAAQVYVLTVCRTPLRFS